MIAEYLAGPITGPEVVALAVALVIFVLAGAR